MRRKDEATGKLVCFVCAVPLDLDGAADQRLACSACYRRARLVASGALLHVVVDSGRHHLEGNGFSVILNPLEIDGRRAWVHFACGGLVVCGEVLPSADFFDYCAQHGEPGEGILRAIRLLGLEPEADRSSFMRVVSAARPPVGAHALGWLERVWMLTRAATESMMGRKPILSTGDALEAAKALPSSILWTDADGPAMIERLVTLARRGRIHPIASG